MAQGIFSFKYETEKNQGNRIWKFYMAKALQVLMATFLIIINDKIGI